MLLPTLRQGLLFEPAKLSVRLCVIELGQRLQPWRKAPASSSISNLNLLSGFMLRYIYLQSNKLLIPEGYSHSPLHSAPGADGAGETCLLGPTIRYDTIRYAKPRGLSLSPCGSIYILFPFSVPSYLQWTLIGAAGRRGLEYLFFNEPSIPEVGSRLTCRSQD